MESDATGFVLVVLGFSLLWVAMLGLLWRRSLVGMLVGVLFGWLACGVTVIGFAVDRVPEAARVEGGALVMVLALVGGLQVALGLSLVLARVVRRGSLDAQDAGLLEG